MKNKNVKVDLPLNIKEEEKYLYSGHVLYEQKPQLIKRLKNVFVTFSGFCMNDEGLIKECHHEYISQHKDYLNEASYYYYDVTDHPEHLTTLDDNNTYLAIHHPWFNYYHWICESIFRLWMVRSKLKNLILILPEYYKDADFIMGSLEPFKIPHTYYIPQGQSLMVKKLCLPQIKPVCDSYNAKHVREINRFYIDYVTKERKQEVDKIERLYISRKKAGRRQIVNEDKVLEVLQKFEFVVFYPEDHTFLQQVAIFSEAKYVVGTHGSGLTNLLFMKKDTSILELHKNETNELDHPGFLFWYMSHALGVNYYHQSCETHGQKDYFTGDYLVDVPLLEDNLIQMIG